MFNTKLSSQMRAVAGKHSGHLVTCSPSAQPIYDALEHRAKCGNHWARITVTGLQSLCAGRMHLNNVFIKKDTNIAYGNDEFFLILPGCKATVEKQASGEFRVLHIQVDASYGELQRHGKKPGLWRAKQSAEKWKATYIKNGHIEKKNDRVVAITDSRYENQDQILREAINFVKDAPISVGEINLNLYGFDMHHTPGKASIGGMRNVRQANSAVRDPNLHESALLLAKTMYSARDVKNVRWISVQGGSGILTQAMQILADQGVTLKSHYVQFCAPTTNLHKAVTLAQTLKLSKTRNYHHNRNLANLNQTIGGGLLSNYKVPYQRLKSEQGYDSLKFIGDIYKETSAIHAAGVTTLTLGAAAGVTSGMSIPATLMFIGSIAGAAAFVPKVTEAYFPKYHNQIKDRF